MKQLSRDVVGWLVVLRINVDLAILQPYLDLEAGDNQSLKIQVARPGIEPRSSCSAGQELGHRCSSRDVNRILYVLRNKILKECRRPRLTFKIWSSCSMEKRSQQKMIYCNNISSTIRLCQTKFQTVNVDNKRDKMWLWLYESDCWSVQVLSMSLEIPRSILCVSFGMGPLDPIDSISHVV